MITNKMAAALNEQVNEELKSAYLYLAMSLDADSKALKGVANWFFVQWQEEQDHARILQKYLIDQEAKVKLQPLGPVMTVWRSPMDMFLDALEHEKHVTRLIGDLVEMAFMEYDFATLSRLQWFVDEQVEEESSVRGQIDAFARVESQPELIWTLDLALLERQYRPAEPLVQ